MKFGRAVLAVVAVLGERLDEVVATEVGATGMVEAQPVSPAVRGIFDGMGDLWDGATDIFDATKCKEYASAEECCKSCSVCRGGTILKLLYDYDKIPASIKGLLSDDQLATGDLCGVPKDKCTMFTSYFEAIPGSIIKMLEYVHVTVPKYYEEGTCPSTSAAPTTVAMAAVGVLGAAALF